MAVTDPGGPRGPLGPVKISHKKMAAKGSRIDFMFLAPLTRLLDPLLHGDDWTFTSMDTKIGSPTFYTWDLKSTH